MAQLPEREQQILTMHAELVRRVVMAADNPAAQQELEQVLKVSEQNGWTALVATIRAIFKGNRDQAMLNGLDEEDAIIIKAILLGLQNPQFLSQLETPPDAGMAAPGLAHLIQGAASGNLEALQLLGGMAEQMQQAGGDMARIGGQLRNLINGERNPDVLYKGLSDSGHKLMDSILEELGRVNLQ